MKQKTLPPRNYYVKILEVLFKIKFTFDFRVKVDVKNICLPRKPENVTSES